MDINCQLLCVNTKECNYWIRWQEYVEICKRPPNCLPRWLCHFALPPSMNEKACCSTSLPGFGVAGVLDFGLSIKCVVVLYRCFNLHFLDNIRCGASFHVLICHLDQYIFFGKMFVKVFDPFLIGLFVFILLSFKNAIFFQCIQK